MSRSKVSVIAGLALIVLFIAISSQAAGQYDAKGKRDPFVPLIGPDKDKALELEDIISADELVLEGIAVGTGGQNIAILNGRMVKENEKIGSLKIKKISKKSILILIADKEFSLDLSEPGGIKGVQ